MRNLRWGVNKMGGALFWGAAALALLAVHFDLFKTDEEKAGKEFYPELD